MAKVIITLEDTDQGDQVIVAVDWGSAAANELALPHPSLAVRMSCALFRHATALATLVDVAACDLHPGTSTLH